MTTTTIHTHSPSTVQTLGFGGCVAGADCVRSSHGDLLYVETCACGAARQSNSNREWSEEGPWVAPTPAPKPPRYVVERTTAFVVVDKSDDKVIGHHNYSGAAQYQADHLNRRDG